MCFDVKENDGEIMITFDTEGKAHRLTVPAALALRIELYKAVGSAMQTNMIKEHNHVGHQQLS